jgi:hypothetical protein
MQMEDRGIMMEKEEGMEYGSSNENASRRSSGFYARLDLPGPHLPWARFSMLAVNQDFKGSPRGVPAAAGVF